jgi:hypothetical protein
MMAVGFWVAARRGTKECALAQEVRDDDGRLHPTEHVKLKTPKTLKNNENN